MRFLAKNREWFLLGGVLVLALALRLVNIGTEPYWGDEVLSLDVVRHFAAEPASTMVRYLAEVEFHPPLYYLILRPWTAWFGETESATRALSLLFSLGTIGLVYALGKRLFSAKVGLWAALVLAILPIQIEYGQEARPYALFCFFTTLAVFAYIMSSRASASATRDPHPALIRDAWTAVYILSAAAACYLHYSAFFGVTAIALWWLGESLAAPADRRAKEFLRWLLAHTAAFLLFYPWVTPLLYKISLGAFAFLGEKRHALPYRATELLTLVVDQVIWTTKSKSIALIELGTKALAMGALGWAAVMAIATHAKNGWQGNEKRAIRFVVWLAAATVVLFSLSPQAIPYTTIFVRHAIFASVPLALLIGWLIASLPPKRGAILFVLFLASQMTFVGAILEDDSKWDYDHRLRDAGETITTQYKPGDLVIASVSIVRSDLAHYLPEQIPVVELLPIPYYGNDVWRSRETLGLIENESQVRIPRPTDAEIRGKFDRLIAIHQPTRVWLYAFGEYDYSVAGWFNDAGWRQGFKSIGGILRLDMYAKPEPHALQR